MPHDARVHEQPHEQPHYANNVTHQTVETFHSLHRLFHVQANHLTLLSIRAFPSQTQPPPTMSKIIDITSPQHFTQILQSSGIVVTDFWASWCGPCKAIAPMYNQLAENLSRPTDDLRTMVRPCDRCS